MEESRTVSSYQFLSSNARRLFILTAGVQPLSEIFSAAHNQVESRPQASPATKRSPAKTTAPTTAANAKHSQEKAPQPQYPSLPQNLNSFSQYNTDSGYHGLEHDDDDNDGDDDVVLTQVQPESQASTQPLDSQPWKNETERDTSPIQESSTGRRMSETSFHSAQEDRETTAEPMTIDSNIQKKTDTSHPAPQSKQKEPDSSPVPYKPGREAQAQRASDKKSEEAEKKPAKSTEKRPEQKQKEPKPAQTRAPKPQPRQEPEPKSSPQPEPRSESVEIPKSSPAKTPATQPREPRHEEEEDYDGGEREDMELDGLDDIGSPSDGSTPERPPIRKSSLNFASLPAREPLKKSLGGPRISRTSHVDIGKINNTGNQGFLGRQTGEHRTTQADLDEHAQSDKMDVDDAAGASRDHADDETRASKQHNKSSTQRLHEKISMLGKLQPSRPTKSIPNVSGLSSAHVSYPDLPAVNKAETKPETANRGSREMSAGEPMATDEDEWIKPLNTPQRPNLGKSQAFDVAEKSSKAPDRGFEIDVSAARDQSMDEDRTAKPNNNQGAEVYRKSTTPVHSPPKRPMHQKSASVFNTAGEVSTTPVGSPRHQDAPLSASKWKLQSIMKSAKGLFSSTGSVSGAAKVETSSPDEPREPPAKSSTPTKPEGRKTRSSTEREEKRKQKELEDRHREEDEEEEEKAREQEKQKAAQLKAAQEKASQEQENERATSVSAPSPKRIPQPQKHSSKEPETANDTSTKSGIPPPASSQQSLQKQSERRPVKPTREPLQKPKPQPVSIRVGSALSRQIPMAPGSNVQESSVPPAPTPASASKPATVKKKTSNNSLHTVPSNSSFKSSVSSNTQRKAQLASERKKEQEEREVRRKEEQKREVERKRAAQQQEEARRQEMRSRAETERRDRERQGSEDPKKAAHMQAIEKRRLENARRLERQGSQQPSEPERPASQASRPASRLGSIQPLNRSINQPQPNPAKPPKRAMDDEPSNRPAPSKPSTVQPSGETKRRRTEEEHNPPPSVRPTMAPPIRQSNIRKVSSIGSPLRKLYHTDFSGTQKAFFGRPQQTLNLQQCTTRGTPTWLFYVQDRTASKTRTSYGHVQVC